MTRRRVVVHGRVQGVGFRAAVRAAAGEHGVRGWVRNRADGSVEAVLEGDPRDVDGVVERLRTGPPEALVGRVEVSEEPPEGLAGFEVR